MATQTHKASLSVRIALHCYNAHLYVCKQESCLQFLHLEAFKIRLLVVRGWECVILACRLRPASLFREALILNGRVRADNLEAGRVVVS